MDAKMLDGKVAIITGASYGMGRTMAELFAEEGASVVITARGKEKLDDVVKAINDKGGKAVGVVADTCSTEDTKRVFETALREFGDLDILINNAGIGEQKLIDETDDEWMLYVVNTNLGGPMRYIREALKIFLPKNWKLPCELCRLRRALLSKRWRRCRNVRLRMCCVMKYANTLRGACRSSISTQPLKLFRLQPIRRGI